MEDGEALKSQLSWDAIKLGSDNLVNNPKKKKQQQISIKSLILPGKRKSLYPAVRRAIKDFKKITSVTKLFFTLIIKHNCFEKCDHIFNDSNKHENRIAYIFRVATHLNANIRFL